VRERARIESRRSGEACVPYARGQVGLRSYCSRKTVRGPQVSRGAVVAIDRPNQSVTAGAQLTATVNPIGELQHEPQYAQAHALAIARWGHARRVEAIMTRQTKMRQC
jgi:hypothetical protein